MICLTPEQRRELLSRYVGVPRVPRVSTPKPPRQPRKEDVIVPWLLAWPALNNREIAEACGLTASVYYVSQLRRQLGIPTARSTRNDERRQKMLKLKTAGWTCREVGEVMGVAKNTVVGILWRQRNARQCSTTVGDMP